MLTTSCNFPESNGLNTDSSKSPYDQRYTLNHFLSLFQKPNPDRLMETKSSLCIRLTHINIQTVYLFRPYIIIPLVLSSSANKITIINATGIINGRPIATPKTKRRSNSVNFLTPKTNVPIPMQRQERTINKYTLIKNIITLLTSWMMF